MSLYRSIALSLVLWFFSPTVAVSGPFQALVVNDQRLYRDAKVDSKVLARLAPGEEATVTGQEGPLLQLSLTGDRIGWTLANGVIVLDGNPHVPALLFEAAVELARQDSVASWWAAVRLYRKAASLKSDGVYGAEAMWRAAELGWRIDAREKAAISSATLGELNALVQMHPKTPQAARAAALLLRANLCEFWDGTPGCPEAEATAIANYLATYPEAEQAGELRYALAYRHSALVEIYLEHGKPYFSAEKAVENKTKARAAVEALLQKPDAISATWAARAERLLWSLDHNIGVYTSIEVPLHRM